MNAIFRNLYAASCVFILSVIVGCASPDKSYAQTTTEVTLAGWVTVSSGIDAKYISANQGRLDETFDEFVGGLIDDGLELGISQWMKPTYGNENILWIPDADPANRKIRALANTKQQFDGDDYRFVDGTLKVANIDWRYSGYSISKTGTASSSFKTYAFLCSGISVFYWGENGIDRLQDNPDITRLLESLSPKC